MKKYLFFFIILSLIITNSFSIDALAAPSNSAESAFILDAETGAVLYEKNADAQMLIASTTKIMTALIVLENCNSDDIVEIIDRYTSIEGSSMYLKTGQKYTVRELLYGLLLASGNDAAVALACYTAGSIENFAELMNQKAALLGCTNSCFQNPHGLDAERQYSTSRDMAIITAAAMKNHLFCEIVSTKSITINNQTYTNHNKLLWNYDGTLGVKTGYTKSAGRTLVTSAQRNGLKLICVTLNDPNDWRDHEQLYDWAFSQYRRVSISSSDTNYGDVSVISGLKDQVSVYPEGYYHFTVSKDDTLELITVLPKFVYAEVSEGEPAGSINVNLNGAEIREIPLVFAESVALDSAIPLNKWEKIKWLWYYVNKFGVQKFGYYGY